MKISEVFLTIYLWGLAVPVILIAYVVCMIAYPFIDQKTFSRLYEILVGKTILYLMLIPKFWSLKVIDLRKDKTWVKEDEEGKGKEKQFIIVANHVSFIDSMVTTLIPLKKKYILARLFTYIPIFGWLTKSAGYVQADRNDPLLNKDAVQRAIQAINKDDCSFCIFSQGRREPFYKIEYFKTGAFRIAHELNIPILPITLKGTEEAMPIGGFVNFSDIEIIIEEPFFVEDDDYKKWAEYGKKIISSHL